MVMAYEGDLYLYQTANDGEITFRDGQPLMTVGAETAVYLSLFGGNLLDDGTGTNPKTSWWGNLTQPLEKNQYHSRSQYLMRTLPITTANIVAFEKAIHFDLQWLINGNICKEIIVFISTVSVNELNIQIDMIKDLGENTSYSFNWVVANIERVANNVL